MRKKLLQLTIIFLLFTGLCQAQSTQEAFENAYKAYEEGKYVESIRIVSEIEKVLGGTNARIQSLKALNNYENDDLRKALLEIELYFKTNPVTSSTEYLEMSKLRDEVRTNLQQNFNNEQEELRRSKERTLVEINSVFNEKKDLLAFEIAKRAGTVPVLELFLLANSTSYLKTQAQQLIDAEKSRIKFQELIDKGMDYLFQQLPNKAVETFLAASKIQSNDWLTEQIKNSQNHAAQMAYNQGMEHLHKKSWIKAFEQFKYVQSIKPSVEVKMRILEAEDELAFETALIKNDPEMMKAYLSKFKKPVKGKQAVGFLFNYYLQIVEKSVNNGNNLESEKNLASLRNMKSSAFWSNFSPEYYYHLKNHAKNLTKGRKNERKSSIAKAIVHYEELDKESGEKFKTKLMHLKFKHKEWSRSDMAYLVYKTDMDFGDLGIEFGSHNNSSIGFAFSFRASGELLKSDYSGLDSYYLPTSKTHTQNFINILFNKKIIYPVWIFAGGGWTNMYKFDRDFFDSTVGVINYDSVVNTANFEAGINIHLKPIVVSFGVGYSFLNESHKLKLGIVETPLNFSLGVGFGR